MQRITVTIEPALLDEIDAYMSQSGATNRSEALRDLVRHALAAKQPPREKSECVGIVSYALDPTVRDLGRRVPQSRHERHDRTVAAMSVPLDHAAAVEVAVMRGTVEDVSTYANSLFLERGIRHGQLSLIPVKAEMEFHDHGDGKPHSHSHLRVQESF
ncbi:nickel-responsive transcriptional regulator NikR [Pelagibacterium limicola]|uniref:nickel-responsive transcriptional regulator NikR n=1 Tax=Pelagibacterium limicola TaxID=2791022 RepID=UPI0018AFFA2C|nr:nickel-responsive transcriptional regulator NikR [Pelagibacterium limicola]